jgi:hypothetical protein
MFADTDPAEFSICATSPADLRAGNASVAA